MAIAVPFFAVAAVRPAMVERMGHGRGAGWFALSQQTVWHGVNLGMVALSLVFLAMLARWGWRWADEVAATIDGNTLRFHPTVWRDPVPLADVVDVQCVVDRKRPLVRIRLGAGRWIVVRGIDTVEAKAFVARLRLDRAALDARPVAQ